MNSEGSIEKISKGFILWVCPCLGHILKKNKKMRSLNNRDQSSLEKQLIPRLEQGKYKMILNILR